MIELEVCMATQSWVNREYRRELSTHPCAAPVLRVSKVEMLFTTVSVDNEQHSYIGIPLVQMG